MTSVLPTARGQRPRANNPHCWLRERPSDLVTVKTPLTFEMNYAVGGKVFFFVVVVI